MNDELQDLRNSGYKPVLIGPQPFSFDEILRNIDPAPDTDSCLAVSARAVIYLLPQLADVRCRLGAAHVFY